MSATVESLETCDNCGREIGRLETAHLFLDRVVCGQCKAQLEPSNEAVLYWARWILFAPISWGVLCVFVPMVAHLFSAIALQFKNTFVFGLATFGGCLGGLITGVAARRLAYAICPRPSVGGVTVTAFALIVGSLYLMCDALLWMNQEWRAEWALIFGAVVLSMEIGTAILIPGGVSAFKIVAPANEPVRAAIFAGSHAGKPRLRWVKRREFLIGSLATIILAMLIVPPWHDRSGRFSGYHPFFLNDSNAASLDLGRLLIQFACVGIVAGACLLLNRREKM